MGQTQRRKRIHKNIKDGKKGFRTKRRTRDLDLIESDFLPQNLEKVLQPKVDHDLPGSGQFYCVHCAKHYIDAFALKGHLKSKVHRHRVKQLKEGAYTQEEANAAAGMGQYVRKAKPVIPHVAVGVDVSETKVNEETAAMEE